MLCLFCGVNGDSLTTVCCASSALCTSVNFFCNAKSNPFVMLSFAAVCAGEESTAYINVSSGFFPYTSCTLNAFSVNVPVLSVQKTSIEPKSPIADNRFTITLFFFNDDAPLDKQNVI